MATINSSVYTDGISNTFQNTDKIFAVCLLDASNTILATSAPIKYGNSTEAGYITGVITWDDTNKQIKVSSLDFTKTKSIVSSEFAATQFGIAYVTAVSDDTSEAYSGSGTEYYWPEEFGDFLVTGNLSSSISVNQNNNFRFDNITINFSEADSL